LVSRRGQQADFVPLKRRLPLVPVFGNTCSLGD
jgi:hypothetical protein